MNKDGKWTRTKFVIKKILVVLMVIYSVGLLGLMALAWCSHFFFWSGGIGVIKSVSFEYITVERTDFSPDPMPEIEQWYVLDILQLPLIAYFILNLVLLGIQNLSHFILKRHRRQKECQSRF